MLAQASRLLEHADLEILQLVILTGQAGQLDRPRQSGRATTDEEDIHRNGLRTGRIFDDEAIGGKRRLVLSRRHVSKRVARVSQSRTASADSGGKQCF